MKFLSKMKDGGPESKVTGYWLIEWKGLFSIVLLKFEGKSRECYHTHAFDSISWLLKGNLTEVFKSKKQKTKKYNASLKPIITRKTDFHKVSSNGTSWVLSFRGPWQKFWLEHQTKLGTYVLSKGRQVWKLN